MEYNFSEIEKKWQKAWEEAGVYTVSNESDKPHYYVLDMFPYPSGAGLHVGHPLGYIASDIYSRYKRLKGFNVLHPMGFDSYGLPAEQYAIQTGQHPEKTTFENIDRISRSSRKSVSATTGTAKCVPAIRSSISGPNGRSCRCSTAISTQRRRKHNRLAN